MKTKKIILKIIENKNLYSRLIIFLFFSFVIAFNYNLVLSPNNFVIGGISGLAIVINNLTGINKTIFLNIAMVILFIIALIFLEKDKAFKSLFGSLCFNMMVIITEPLTNSISLSFNSTFLLVLMTSIVVGVGYGSAYRVGLTFGGSDIISLIISKYAKISMGQALTWTNIFIIGSGLLVFGPTQTIYSVFILLVGNYIIDIVLLGIKDSKMCFIKSENYKEISSLLINKVKVGVTEINTKGGILTKKEPILLVIIPFDQYYGLKDWIQKIDKKAFILTSDCYCVDGGYKKHLLPF